MIRLWFYGVAATCLLIALAPSSVSQQSDAATTGLTVLTATGAVASVGYIALCITQFFLLTDNARRIGYEEGKEKGGADGKKIGEAEGTQMAEEECGKVISAKNTELQEKCQKEIDNAVAAILQEELDGRQNAIDITVSGFKTDAAALLEICILRVSCTSDDTASCTSVTIDGTDLCVTTTMVV